MYGWLRVPSRRAILCAAALGWAAMSRGAAAQQPEANPPTQAAANPARPTVTNPATLPPVGYLQFEQGYLGSVDSPETASQYGANLVAKLAVHPRVMAEVQTQPWARSRAATHAASNGSGDVLAGAQAVLFNAPESSDEVVKDDLHRHAYVRSAMPTIALAYLNRVHSGTTPDIDVGSQSRTLIALFSGHAPGIDVHYDANFVAGEQPGSSAGPEEHAIRRAQFGETFSIDRQLFTPNLQFALEAYHFSQPLLHATARGRAVERANLVDGLFALSYSLRPNLVLDGGCAHGFTSTSTRWQSFAGFTYLLPKPLWPRRS